jgi:hypothetical protein
MAARGKKFPQSREPEFLPSTTRAVAWGALFFSVLAFILSLATVFLTWQDGRLGKNMGIFVEELRGTFQSRAEFKETPEGGVRWQKLHDRFGRLEKMVKEGDERAQVHLESMRDELNSLGKYGSRKFSEWFSSAGETLGEVKGEFRKNGSEAADKLRILSNDLKDRFISTGSRGIKDDDSGPSQNHDAERIK